METIFAHIARAIENHGVRAFAGGIVFQREVFWSDREPVIARGGFSGREDAQSSAKKGDAANESLGSIHGRSVLQVPLRNGVRGCTSNRGSAARLEGAPLPSGELNANLTHGDAPVNSAVMLASRGWQIELLRFNGKVICAWLCFLFVWGGRMRLA